MYYKCYVAIPLNNSIARWLCLKLFKIHIAEKGTEKDKKYADLTEKFQLNHLFKYFQIYFQIE